MDPSCNVVTSPTLRFTSGSTRLPTAHVVSPVSHIYPLGQGFQHPHHLLHWCCRHLQTSLNEPPFNRKKAITTYMAGCKTHLQLQALLIPMPYLRRYKVSGMMPDILGQFVRYSYSSLFIHRGITNVKFLQSGNTRLNGCCWSLFTIFLGISISSCSWTSKKTSSLWHACGSSWLEA